MIDPQVQVLTWAASVICALAISIESIRTLKGWKRGLEKPAFFLLESRWFLPFYFAGISQWMIFGLRSGELSLSIPCGVQLVCLAPLLVSWAQRRMTE